MIKELESILTAQNIKSARESLFNGKETTTGNKCLALSLFEYFKTDIYTELKQRLGNSTPPIGAEFKHFLIELEKKYS